MYFSLVRIDRTTAVCHVSLPAGDGMPCRSRCLAIDENVLPSIKRGVGTDTSVKGNAPFDRRISLLSQKDRSGGGNNPYILECGGVVFRKSQNLGAFLFENNFGYPLGGALVLAAIGVGCASPRCLGVLRADVDVSEVRISLFSKGNYIKRKHQITAALLGAA